MDTSSRRAGLGLLAYGLGTPIAFMAIGSPGGDYIDSRVVAYMARGHWVAASALAYLGIFAAVGFLVFAHDVRHRLGAAGDLLWALAVAGTSAAVVGWFLVGGISIAFAEGGAHMPAVPHGVVQLVAEMSNLVAVCASAFFIGVAAIVLAVAGGLPRPARIATWVAGVCGVFAAAFFPAFLFWLWAIVLGSWMATRRRKTASAAATRDESVVTRSATPARSASG